MDIKGLAKTAAIAGLTTASALGETHAGNSYLPQAVETNVFSSIEEAVRHRVNVLVLDEKIESGQLSQPQTQAYIGMARSEYANYEQKIEGMTPETVEQVVSFAQFQAQNLKPQEKQDIISSLNAQYGQSLQREQPRELDTVPLGNAQAASAPRDVDEPFDNQPLDKSKKDGVVLSGTNQSIDLSRNKYRKDLTFFVERGTELTIKNAFFDAHHFKYPEGTENLFYTGYNGNMTVTAYDANGKGLAEVTFNNAKITTEYASRQYNEFQDLNKADAARHVITEGAEVLRGNKSIGDAVINSGEAIGRAAAGWLGNANQFKSEFEDAQPAQANDLMHAIRVQGEIGVPNIRDNSERTSLESYQYKMQSLDNVKKGIEGNAVAIRSEDGTVLSNPDALKNIEAARSSLQASQKVSENALSDAAMAGVEDTAISSNLDRVMNQRNNASKGYSLG